jgi:2-polyprenyl-3-methyl-5-hydroxy-6-metoxy-1,4-benzoquinol methylase
MTAYAYEQNPVDERRVLLDHVPHGCRVLDVGCWSGYNGAYLQGRGCSITGVEIDPGAAKLAAEHEKVYVGDISDPSVIVRIAADAPFDAILLLDVLEHLAEPHEVLPRLVDLLRADGIALVSLPNVAHWSVRKALLAGRWTYTPAGILDGTHLRFYTAATAQDLLRGAGLSIETLNASRSPLPLMPSWAPLERRVTKRWPQIFGVQLLFVARRHGGAGPEHAL